MNGPLMPATADNGGTIQASNRLDQGGVGPKESRVGHEGPGLGAKTDLLSFDGGRLGLRVRAEQQGLLADTC